MKNESIARLICPVTRLNLELETAQPGSNELENGMLVTPDHKTHYPIRNGIPRFVAPDNYASSFGYQWKKYARLQLDSCNGTQFSRERFYSITDWNPSELRGKRILDVGCGAGRFAEIALAAGAEVVAMDLSEAVDACKENLRNSPNLEVVQASIYE